MTQEEEWRILAEEAAQEKDPDKLLKIVQALNRALDEQEQHKAVVERSRRKSAWIFENPPGPSRRKSSLGGIPAL